MRYVLAALILALAGSASAITATREYVDRRDQLIVTNVIVRATNDTLAAANRYTDEHGGSGSVSPSMATNIAARVTSNVVTKAYVESLGISTGGGSAVWSSPGCWGVDVTMCRSTSSGAYDAYATNALRISVARVETNLTTLAADCSIRMLDDLTIDPAPAVDWLSPPGTTISTNGHFTATNDALYRVAARDRSGVTRYADIAASSPRLIVETNVWTYVADVSGSAVAAANDRARAACSNATFVTRATYAGRAYNVWNTFTPTMSSTGAGNVRCWAVSPHVLASANHYAVKPLGTQTFTDGVTSATVTKLEWVRLSDWAVTNGWSRGEIAAMNIDDICLIRCAKSSAVPDGCIPHFLDRGSFAANYGGTLERLSGWASCQDWPYAVPILFAGEYGESWTTASDAARSDIRARLIEMGEPYIVHSGDSGRCVFLSRGSTNVVVSTFTTAGSGPCWIKAFEVVKAFVEAYGDNLKEAF